MSPRTNPGIVGQGSSQPGKKRNGTYEYSGSNIATRKEEKTAAAELFFAFSRLVGHRRDYNVLCRLGGCCILSVDHIRRSAKL